MITRFRLILNHPRFRWDKSQGTSLFAPGFGSEETGEKAGERKTAGLGQAMDTDSSLVVFSFYTQTQGCVRLELWRRRGDGESKEREKNNN